MFKVKLLICICRVFFPLHQFTNNKVWKTIYKDDWYCYTQNKRTISIWPSSLRPLSRSIITKQLKPQSQYNENTVGWHRTVFWSAFWIPQSHTQIRSICPPTVKIMSSLGVFLNSSLFIDACHYSKRKKKKKNEKKTEKRSILSRLFSSSECHSSGKYRICHSEPSRLWLKRHSVSRSENTRYMFSRILDNSLGHINTLTSICYRFKVLIPILKASPTSPLLSLDET